MYEQIAAEEEEWLAQEELDFSNDPDDHFVDALGYRAVLNADGEVQVGGYIYKLTENGYFQILDGNVESLQDIEDIANGRKAMPDNIVFVGDGYDAQGRELASGCKSSKSKKDFEERSDGKRRIKWKVKHATPLFGDRQVYAKTVNYKKKKKKWKKYRTSVSAQVYGYISGEDGNCDTQVDFNSGNPYYNAESKKKSVKHKIFVQTKTKSGWVKGNHYGAGGVEYESTLTF